MIKVHCRTNLDKYHGTEWPEVLQFPPRVGDYIEGRSGGPASRPRLRIVAVTHSVDCVTVELHK